MRNEAVRIIVAYVVGIGSLFFTAIALNPLKTQVIALGSPSWALFMLVAVVWTIIMFIIKLSVGILGVNKEVS